MPAAATKNWPRSGLYCCKVCEGDFDGPPGVSRACPACGWSLHEFAPIVVERHRYYAESGSPLSFVECADQVVLRDIGRPLFAAPTPLVLGFGIIAFRGDGRLDINLTDEEESLALLGIAPNGEEGLDLWLGLN